MKYDKTNPFLVPEDYFNQLHDKVMARLPEQNHTIGARRTFWLRPVITAAAAVCLAIFGLSAYLYFDQSAETEATVAATGSNQDDYIILDNGDIYSYIAEL